MRRSWRWRTGCSTPPGTATCSCTSTPRSPTSPKRVPTGSGGPRTRSGTTSTSARSPRSSPSTWKRPSPHRFGLEWVARDDGHGFEIKGICGEMMRRVLLAPRIDHGRLARPRGAVRAAVRPRAVPARARAPRAGVELHDAQPQARRAGSRAGARGLGGQARADARRERWLRSRRRCGMAQPAARPRTRPARKPRFCLSSSWRAPRRRRSRWRSRTRARGPART